MLKFSFTTTRGRSLEAARFFRGDGASAIITDPESSQKRIVSLAKSGLLSRITASILSAISFVHQYRSNRTRSFPIQTTLTFNDETIKVEGDAIPTTVILWKDVKRAVNATSLIVLYTLDLFIVLPKRAIEANKINEELMQLIDQNLPTEVQMETID